MKKQSSEQLLKSLLSLAVLVLICGFLARTLTRSESLADYASKNPDTAYDDSTAHIDENEDAIADGENKPMTTDDHEMEQNDGSISATESVQDSDAQTEETEPTAAQTESSPDIPADRIVYQDGFYYEPLTEKIKEKISGISYPVSASKAADSAIPVLNTLEDGVTPAVLFDDLRYLSVLYYDFNGEEQCGELICNKGIAEDLAEIFYELYVNEYQIEKIKLIEEYEGDDIASMTDNNTSCFNYRVVDGTNSLSKHALGCAIDINPFYNPYIVYNHNGTGETYISPAGSEQYADRSKDFPYKIDENDLCYRLFKEHGFVWGGDWNSCKDYQHFQKAVE